MKTLLLVRHAKSSWENFGTPDFDRPLNDRGKKDAPEMAKRTKKRGIRPDLLLSSPAKRAKKTCEAFAEVFDMQPVFEDTLYHASPATFKQVISSIAKKQNTVLVFSHNDGITQYANALVDNVRIDNMPTCGIFAVQADVEDWSDFANAEKKFLFFDYPKNQEL